MRRLIAGAGAAVGALALGLWGAVPAQAVTTYSYSVAVKSTGGGGIPGVWVVVFDGYGAYASGATDANGTFTAADLPAGSAYTLDVSDPITYKTIEQTVAVGSGATSKVVTIAGSQLVRGKVTDTAGKALADIDVSVYPTTSGTSGWAHTAADGSYAAVVKSGSYHVSVGHWDTASSTYDYGTLYYPNTYSYSKAGTVKVTTAKDVTLSTVKVAKNGKVSGKITAAGKAAASASVRLDATNGASGYATTSSTGAFTISVPPGTYTAQTYPATGASWLPTYAGNTVREPDSTPVKVTSGGATTVNIAAVAGASIQGKVVDKAGKAVKGVAVNATNTTRAGYGYATTDASGHYVLRGLATGPVQVSVSNGAYNNTTTVAAVQGKTVTAKTLSTKAPSGGVSVTAKVSSGKVTAVDVVLLDAKKHLYDSRTPSTSGKVTFSHLPKGTYYVSIAGTNVAKKVTVSTKTVSAGTIKAAKFTSVTGKVTTSGGKLAAGARVYLYDAYGTYAAAGTVSSKGTYSLKHVVSGSYTLAVYPKSSSDAPVVAKVTVKKGHTLTKNVRFVRAGTLAGYVKNSKGKAVAGITVYGGGWASTSATGRFSVPSNTPGTVLLQVYDPYTGGYRNKSVAATAKAGKTVTVKTIVVS